MPSPAASTISSTDAAPLKSEKPLGSIHVQEQHEKGGEATDERGRRVFRSSTPCVREPAWARWVPGGYNRHMQVPFQGKSMMWAIQAVCGLAILFYGYDQGVMSGVNNNLEYRRLMGVDSQERTGAESSRDSAAIGGIVAIYYVGTLIGGFFGGWLGDSIGRIKTIEISCLFSIFGAGLQASAENITWMMFGRVITGLGTGGLNAIVPVLSSELATHTARGAIMGFEFFLNIGGLATAYWLQFGLKWTTDRSDSFNWRFPLAFQIVFLLILLFSISIFPESPRWLAQVGREAEARHVLAVCRTHDGNEDDEMVSAELYDILEVVESERQLDHLNNYFAIFFGSADSYHLRRRSWLVVCLKCMAEGSGIGVITVYASTVFTQAGYSAHKAELLSGINDIAYMFSVLVAVFTADRVGRRVTMFSGSTIMGSCLIIAGAAARYVYVTEGAARDRYGAVVTTFIFIFTSTYGATWLTVPWLYPTEIFPLFIRAKGGAVSVLGFSIGNGVITEITPFLFHAITYWTFILFGILNFIILVPVYFLYPETAGRTLEEMDILFSSDSLLVHRQERDLAAIAESEPEVYKAMQSGNRQELQRKQSYRPKDTDERVENARRAPSPDYDSTNSMV